MATKFCLLLLGSASALHAYGHAYQDPGDFSAAQYAAIAAKFPVFTVEKRHANAVYGNQSAATHGTPAYFNSIAASVGTARKIKALNASVKVLMYWNSALHFNFYECESEVQPSWLLPPKHTAANANAPLGAPSQRVYNYSVGAFRAWWVRCAADAVRGSGGALDGLFLDAVPKVDTLMPEGGAPAQAQWNAMLDELRAALGPDALLLYNGFFLSPGAGKLAGDDAWAHAGAAYTESLSKVGTDNSSAATLDRDVEHLAWIAAAAAAHPERVLVGHGNSGTAAAFEYGLAKYLLICATQAEGFFLANSGYEIDQGVLLPQWQYDYAASEGGGGNFTLGEPLGNFTRGGAHGYVLQRRFSGGSVEVDLQHQTSAIALSSTTTAAALE